MSDPEDPLREATKEVGKRIADRSTQTTAYKLLLMFWLLLIQLTFALEGVLLLPPWMAATVTLFYLLWYGYWVVFFAREFKEAWERQHVLRELPPEEHLQHQRNPEEVWADITYRNRQFVLRRLPGVGAAILGGMGVGTYANAAAGILAAVVFTGFSLAAPIMVKKIMIRWDKIAYLSAGQNHQPKPKPDA
jgi:hypothetical protein